MGFKKILFVFLIFSFIFSNLVDLVIAESSIALTWIDNSEDEVGFYIERAVGLGSFLYFAEVGANIVQYTDTSVEPSMIYNYRVYSYNSNGISDYSNLVEVAIPASTPGGSGGGGSSGSGGSGGGGSSGSGGGGSGGVFGGLDGSVTGSVVDENNEGDLNGDDKYSSDGNGLDFQEKSRSGITGFFVSEDGLNYGNIGAILITLIVVVVVVLMFWILKKYSY
ncbi:MAG: fibronectin type III domain-containing protein [Candidatus Pacearchaeota archaeon]|nr:fibronectin type III domain-containing protein [Candidatus Pacearchaeota archaeon]